VKRENAVRRSRPDCAGRRFAIVAAQFHADLAEWLLDGARRALRDCNVADADTQSFEVPGCFELPLACRTIAEKAGVDAIVALGVVIRGETSHYELVAGEAARGIMNIMLATGTPIGFGVLTTENLMQAQERADPQRGDKGYWAALAAAEMLQELRSKGRI
jgi:6,7-dimethyl-8-ribityllumazine synthase